ncbi:hypothetical protein PIB30_019911 [Stylosanthes scabra]|uniref:DUF4283 domain-containing protein n=1 Tax=Stylosanthes scabra TaxID=79078 RepID=A0ABU6V7S3_9FABA|nr:hypothetical protein [Stylosanthes scabra]
MDLIELRDRALADSVFVDMFDEVRCYWGFKCAFSRRVWVELMGLPLQAWSNEAFETIVNGINGKLVKQHEITEERRSFSVVRLLIDCFQWEPIQEWISVKYKGAIFDVYIKEFGGEVLTSQVHHDDFYSDDTVVENLVLPSMASIHDGGKNGDEERTEDAKTPRVERDIGNAGEVSLRNDNCVNQDLGNVKGGVQMQNVIDNGVMKEAQENKDWAIASEGTNGLKEGGSCESNELSCPFPPGFGPCKNGLHIHSELGSGRGNEVGDPELESNRDSIGNPNTRRTPCESPGEKCTHNSNA